MPKPDVETVDIPGYDALQGFVSYIYKEDVMHKLFDISVLPEGTIIYYIYPEETNLFFPKKVQNVVSAIKI